MEISFKNLVTATILSCFGRIVEDRLFEGFWKGGDTPKFSLEEEGIALELDSSISGDVWLLGKLE